MEHRLTRFRKIARLLLVSLVLVFSLHMSVFAFGKGAQGPDVYAVQAMLKSLGYFQGDITGYYGTVTEHSVKLFQKRYGLTATGAVDDKTLESILWAYGNQKIPQKTTPTPTPAPTPQPTPDNESAGDKLSAEEQRMVQLVNQARAEAGLAALSVDMDLTKVARVKSQDMIDQSYFAHQSPTYGSPFDMMKTFGIAFKSAGENIACNQTVEAAHQALMNSSGHRANILSTTYTHIGIGIVDGGTCGKMFTQMFISK